MRRTTLLLLPVALPFSAGALALRLLLHHAPSRIAKDLAQPLPVVTSWGSFGAACFTVLALTIALSAVALIVAMLRLARTEEHASDAPSRDGGARHAVACVATLALAGAFAWPAIFSSDPYAYAAYGSLALHGFDPYAPVAATVHGPLVDAARYQWNGAFPPCVYGPLFVTLAAAIVAATAAGGAALTLG